MMVCYKTVLNISLFKGGPQKQGLINPLPGCQANRLTFDLSDPGKNVVSKQKCIHYIEK